MWDITSEAALFIETSILAERTSTGAKLIFEKKIFKNENLHHHLWTGANVAKLFFIVADTSE
jgi:hypothetical protein